MQIGFPLLLFFFFFKAGSSDKSRIKKVHLYCQFFFNALSLSSSVEKGVQKILKFFKSVGYLKVHSLISCYKLWENNSLSFIK